MTTLSTGSAASAPCFVPSPILFGCPERRPSSDATAIVYIVDDDLSVLESLKGLVRSAGWEPETFESARDFLSRPHPAIPCCVVLEVKLPVLSGLDLQKRLAARSDMPIIFITEHADVPTTVQAMKAGAVEFLTKPLRGDVLLNAIGGAIERSCAALRLDAAMLAARNCYLSLSPREREVTALVVSGLLNKQVADELGISEITVKQHRARVMRKMTADSLADLVITAARLGLASPRKSRRLADSPQELVRIGSDQQWCDKWLERETVAGGGLGNLNSGKGGRAAPRAVLASDPRAGGNGERADRRMLNAQFKAKIALLALRGDPSVAEIADRNQLHPNQVTQWKTQLVEHAAAAFDAGAVSPDLTRVVKELHAKISQMSVENEFLSSALG